MSVPTQPIGTDPMGQGTRDMPLTSGSGGLDRSQGQMPGQIPLSASTGDTPLSAESGRPEQYVGFWSYYSPNRVIKDKRAGAKWFER